MNFHIHDFWVCMVTKQISFNSYYPSWCTIRFWLVYIIKAMLSKAHYRPEKRTKVKTCFHHDGYGMRAWQGVWGFSQTSSDGKDSSLAKHANAPSLFKKKVPMRVKVYSHFEIFKVKSMRFWQNKAIKSSFFDRRFLEDGKS